MKIKRIIGAALSICMVWGAVEYTFPTVNETVITADAAKQSSNVDSDFNKFDNKEVIYTPDKNTILEGHQLSSVTDVNNYGTNNVKLWFDKTTIEYKDISGKSHVTQKVDLNISGIDENIEIGKGTLHIYYDTRLTIQGSGINYAAAGSALSDSISMSRNNKNGEIVFMFDDSKNAVKNGVLCSLTFELPSNAKAADLYPIGIKYSNADGYGDFITNVNKDITGMSRSAYIFMNGITNGYIKIGGGSIKGDISGDGAVDGSDATMALKEYASLGQGISTLTAAQSAAADVNGSGNVDGSDATMILRCYALAGGGVTPNWYHLFDQ